MYPSTRSGGQWSVWRADVDRVLLGGDVGELGQGDGSHRHVLVRLPGGELAAAVRDLEDPIGAGLAQTFEGGHDRGRGGDVDGGKREPPVAGGIEHLPVLLWRGDGHGIREYRMRLTDSPSETLRNMLTR